MPQLEPEQLSATGIGDGETYIRGGDYSGYSDYSEDDGLDARR